MVTAGRAWAVLVAGIAVYEALCPEGHLLTDGIRSAQRTALGHVATSGAVIATAAHLVGVLPPAVDPFTQVTRLKRSRYVRRRPECRDPRVP